ncbi:hypothetical protein [uncultured Bacteroides sp.]|uniref:hypothetical protein n=1 Tax=uncultured Bacteroides sp. TaxID=162156 RepID=UPI002623BF45|nr:hypothetical protein [uncultured Bacteroides sp.]
MKSRVSESSTTNSNQAMELPDNLVPAVYLNGHNKPRPLDDIGMREEDSKMVRKKGIYHSDILHF